MAVHIYDYTTWLQDFIRHTQLFTRMNLINQANQIWYAPRLPSSRCFVNNINPLQSNFYFIKSNRSFIFQNYLYFYRMCSFASSVVCFTSMYVGDTLNTSRKASRLGVGGKKKDCKTVTNWPVGGAMHTQTSRLTPSVWVFIWNYSKVFGGLNPQNASAYFYLKIFEFSYRNPN